MKTPTRAVTKVEGNWKGLTHRIRKGDEGSYKMVISAISCLVHVYTPASNHVMKEADCLTISPAVHISLFNTVPIPSWQNSYLCYLKSLRAIHNNI